MKAELIDRENRELMKGDLIVLCTNECILIIKENFRYIAIDLESFTVIQIASDLKKMYEYFNDSYDIKCIIRGENYKIVEI